MAKPAPYSKTDTAENAAVAVFNSLIDADRVKAEIRTRDRYPNVDGVVEIVDEEGYPIGKFDAQIKKMKTGDLKYRCPVTLVEYSKVSGLPLILICVDVEQKIAFWQHIFPAMPGIKDQTKVFTVHFDAVSDIINDNRIYLDLWIKLIKNHNKILSEYPFLLTQFKQKVVVETLTSSDISVIQLFLDQINSLLDHDFLTVKRILLPDTCKIGLGVLDSNDRQISYQVYKLNDGQAGPLICSLQQDDSGQIEHHHLDELSEHWNIKTYFEDPQTNGKSFVSSFVKEVFESRRFYIHGTHLAMDIVFNFLDRYAHCLGLNLRQPFYTLQSISHGLHEYLPAVCEQVQDLLQDSAFDDSIFTNFDIFADTVFENEIQPEPSAESNSNGDSSFSFPILDLLSDSIRYLRTVDMPEIRRPYRLPEQHSLLNRISCLPKLNCKYEQYKIRNILKYAVQDYADFVQGNLLNFPNSPYLAENISLVYCLEIRPRMDGDVEFILHEYHVINNNILPKTLFFNRLLKPDYGGGAPHIRVRNEPFRCIRVVEKGASELFGKFPVLDKIYSMLRNDLAQHYGSEFNYSGPFSPF